MGIRAASAFAFVLLGGVFVLTGACSSSTTETSSSSSTSSSGSSSSGGAVPSDCVAQCTEQATGCKQDTSRCSQLCGQINGTQFSCIKAAGCDEEAAADCLKSSSSSSGGSSGASSSSGGSSGACIKMNATGCNTLNNPSNCCTDADHSDVVCNGNNDGKGHAQCCVNPGKGCTKASDCCGYATNPSLYDCKSGKCSSL